MNQRSTNNQSTNGQSTNQIKQLCTQSIMAKHPSKPHSQLNNNEATIQLNLINQPINPSATSQSINQSAKE
jgi:hypothetical protein